MAAACRTAFGAPGPGASDADPGLGSLSRRGGRKGDSVQSRRRSPAQRYDGSQARVAELLEADHEKNVANRADNSLGDATCGSSIQPF